MDNTPVLISGGQSVSLGPKLQSPWDLAAGAAELALESFPPLRPELDTICAIRTFSDSTPIWKSPFGRSSNPPGSIASRLGLSPENMIYSQVGGTEPLSLLGEMAAGIASGEKKVVLLCGGESIAMQKAAIKNGQAWDLNEDPPGPLEDRGLGQPFMANEELAAGITTPILYYSLIENRLAHLMGHSQREHLQFMGELMAPFSKIAAENPYGYESSGYIPSELTTALRHGQAYSKQFG